MVIGYSNRRRPLLAVGKAPFIGTLVPPLAASLADKSRLGSMSDSLTSHPSAVLAIEWLQRKSVQNIRMPIVPPVEPRPLATGASTPI
jgi:hypothetical protein